MFNERPSLAIHALLTMACAPVEVDSPSGPRVCTPERCPAGGCRVSAQLAPECTNAGAVEVLLDGGLEPELLVAATPWESVGEIAAGETASAVFKGDSLAWSLTVTCPEASPAGADRAPLELVLTCTGGPGAQVSGPGAEVSEPLP